MPKKRIPSSVTNFEEIITKNYYYVDKTMYIEKLEDTDEVITYLRPRRFGKTLFTSMLYYYYDINSKDKFDRLFKNTYVYNHPVIFINDKGKEIINKNNYYILKFDFSGMNIKLNDLDSIISEFNECIYIGINDFLNDYKLQYDIDYNLSPSALIKRFFTFFKNLNLNNKLYIIIDEYDNFTNQILSSDVNMFKDILGDKGFVKAFYAAIKEARADAVERVFVTGVSSISLDAMTSGFNISTNITNNKMFNAMTGLTHEEVKTLVDYMDISNKKKVFKEMLDNYDGYKFNAKEELVFNPRLVMYYLSSYELLNEAPENLMDPNIIPNYNQIANIVKLNNNKYYNDVISKLLVDNKITSELRVNFELDTELDSSDIVSLLYYFGYITILDKVKDSDELVFTIPNILIKNIFEKYFNKVLKDNDISIDNSTTYDIVEEVSKYGKIDKLCQEVERILKEAGTRTLIRFDEKYIQLLINSIMTKNNKFNVYLEQPLNGGFCDVYLKKKNEALYDILIEIKYIKKEDYSNRLLKEKKKQGIGQIKSYYLDSKIDKTNTKKYVVIYSSNNLKLIEEVK